MTFEQFLLNEIRIYQVHLAIVQRNHLVSFDDLLQLRHSRQLLTTVKP